MINRCYAHRLLLAASCLGSCLPTQAQAQQWTQATKLAPTGAEPGSYFGSSVAIGASEIMVGAFSERTVGEAQGVVYFYSGDNWSKVQRLVPSDPAKYDDFGFAVGVSGDKAVASCGLIDNSKIYFLSRANGTWSEQQIVKSTGPAATGFFGYAVAIAGDTALITAPKENADTGRVYVYQTKDGKWSERGSFGASDAAPSDFFGFTVELSGDTAVVGAPGNALELSRQPAAYVFVQKDGAWK